MRELWGGNFSMRRADCLAIGMTNPGFTEHYHADRDFGIRCLEAGLTRGTVRSRALAATHLHLSAPWKRSSAMLAARAPPVSCCRGFTPRRSRRRPGANSPGDSLLPSPCWCGLHADRGPTRSCLGRLPATSEWRRADAHVGRTGCDRARASPHQVEQHGAIEQPHLAGASDPAVNVG